MITFDGDENEPTCSGVHAGVILAEQVQLRLRVEAVVGGDGGEGLAIERVGEEQPVVRRDIRVPAGAVDGDVDGAGVGDVGGGVRVGLGEPVGRGEVVEMAGDAGVGVAAGDLVGEGSGEVGGEGRPREREAVAAEVDVDAFAGGDEVQVGVAGVVGRQRLVVADAEEARDVGEVLVPGDEVGAEREVAAAPRRRRGRRRRCEEEEPHEDAWRRHVDGRRGGAGRGGGNPSSGSV